MKDCGAGVKPFGDITAAAALKRLRSFLAILKLPDFQLYRTHDLRRGHARDLQAAGKSLWEILSAGDWRSAAFLQYLDKEDLERAVVEQAHEGESQLDQDLADMMASSADEEG